jgi:hypothetical protein
MVKNSKYIFFTNTSVFGELHNLHSYTLLQCSHKGRRYEKCHQNVSGNLMIRQQLRGLGEDGRVISKRKNMNTSGSSWGLV